MNAAEYSRQLYKEEPSYKGNEITKCCKDFFPDPKILPRSGVFSYTTWSVNQLNTPSLPT